MASRTPHAAAAESPEAGTSDSLAALVCFDLYSASRSVTAVYRTVLEPLGLTYPQYLVMVVLWRHGQRTVRGLVEELKLDYNTVSPLLKRLESAGLLTRQRRVDDERSVTITLTDAGRTLQAQAEHVPAVISEALGIDGDIIATLQSILRKITASTAEYTANH